MSKPIKSMIYTELTNNAQVLYEDKYKGIVYYIISYGTHPCCYLLLPKGNKYYNKPYTKIPLDVHGGLTYASSKHFLIDNVNKEWIIGWDYAHYGDRFGLRCYNFTKFDHTWKTTELIRECVKAIDELEVICNGKKIR